MWGLGYLIVYAIGGIMGFAACALFMARSRGETIDLGKLRSEALMFVAAAEKLLPGKDGSAKLEYVLDQLDNLGLFRGLPHEVIRAAVEWAVGVWKHDGFTYVTGEIAAMDDDPLKVIGQNGS